MGLVEGIKLNKDHGAVLGDRKDCLLGCRNYERWLIWLRNTYTLMSQVILIEHLRNILMASRFR